MKQILMATNTNEWLDNHIHTHIPKIYLFNHHCIDDLINLGHIKIKHYRCSNRHNRLSWIKISRGHLCTTVIVIIATWVLHTQVPLGHIFNRAKINTHTYKLQTEKINECSWMEWIDKDSSWKSFQIDKEIYAFVISIWDDFF